MTEPVTLAGQRMLRGLDPVDGAHIAAVEVEAVRRLEEQIRARKGELAIALDAMVRDWENPVTDTDDSAVANQIIDLLLKRP